jgi:L-lactate utilization protein LutB
MTRARSHDANAYVIIIAVDSGRREAVVEPKEEALRCRAFFIL